MASYGRYPVPQAQPSGLSVLTAQSVFPKAADPQAYINFASDFAGRDPRLPTSEELARNPGLVPIDDWNQIDSVYNSRKLVIRSGLETAALVRRMADIALTVLVGIIISYERHWTVYFSEVIQWEWSEISPTGIPHTIDRRRWSEEGGSRRYALTVEIANEALIDPNIGPGKLEEMFEGVRQTALYTIAAKTARALAMAPMIGTMKRLNRERRNYSYADHYTMMSNDLFTGVRKPELLLSRIDSVARSIPGADAVIVPAGHALGLEVIARDPVRFKYHATDATDNTMLAGQILKDIDTSVYKSLPMENGKSLLFVVNPDLKSTADEVEEHREQAWRREAVLARSYVFPNIRYNSNLPVFSIERMSVAVLHMDKLNAMWHGISMAHAIEETNCGYIFMDKNGTEFTNEFKQYIEYMKNPKIKAFHDSHTHRLQLIADDLANVGNMDTPGPQARKDIDEKSATGNMVLWRELSPFLWINKTKDRVVLQKTHFIGHQHEAFYPTRVALDTARALIASLGGDDKKLAYKLADLVDCSSETAGMIIKLVRDHDMTFDTENPAVSFAIYTILLNSHYGGKDDGATTAAASLNTRMDNFIASLSKAEADLSKENIDVTGDATTRLNEVNAVLKANKMNILGLVSAFLGVTPATPPKSTPATEVKSKADTLKGELDALKVLLESSKDDTRLDALYFTALSAAKTTGTAATIPTAKGIYDVMLSTIKGWQFAILKAEKLHDELKNTPIFGSVSDENDAKNAITSLEIAIKGAKTELNNFIAAVNDKLNTLDWVAVVPKAIPDVSIPTALPPITTSIYAKKAALMEKIAPFRVKQPAVYEILANTIEKRLEDHKSDFSASSLIIDHLANKLTELNIQPNAQVADDALARFKRTMPSQKALSEASTSLTANIAVSAVPLGAPVTKAQTVTGVDDVLTAWNAKVVELALKIVANLLLPTDRMLGLGRTFVGQSTLETLFAMAILTRPMSPYWLGKLARLGIQVLQGSLERYSERYIVSSMGVMRRGEETVSLMMTPLMSEMSSKGLSSMTVFGHRFHMGHMFKNWDGIREIFGVFPYATAGGTGTQLCRSMDDVRHIFTQSDVNSATRFDLVFIPRPYTETRLEYPGNLFGDEEVKGQHNYVREMTYLRKNSGHVVLRRMLGPELIGQASALLDSTVSRSYGIVAMPYCPFVERAATYYSGMNEMWNVPTHGTGPLGPMVYNNVEVVAGILNGGRGAFPDTYPQIAHVQMVDY